MNDSAANVKRPEKWGSRMGVVLAVAGSAVGLGNFLRFPGTAVQNGGGAFMIPYFISFLVLGIPIAWCEWTLGRLGGRFGQNNAPGIFAALSNNFLGRITGVLTLLVPVGVYMYYVVLEALCLRYCIEFASGGFAELFAAAKAAAPAGEQSASVVSAVGEFTMQTAGMLGDGSLFASSMLWLVLLCFVVNFFIIYRGVARGIEQFCLTAMPLLIACAVIILIRVLTLTQTVEGRTIEAGLGFMWNPDWHALTDPEVWLRAAGQIFFSLSVGFGLILCYASYLRKDDDVVLTSLTASSTNEFSEVILGGLIVVPAAFLFLGPTQATGSTFGLGFFTVPAIMNFMPGGSFFGAMWFGLLFLAAVTSSISMLQPAIAFLENGFGLKRTGSVTLLGAVTLVGAGLIMFYSEQLQALDFADFLCSFGMIVAALGQVIIFGWIVGAQRGVQETNRGGAFDLPRFMPFVIRYVTPAFLILVLVMWVSYEAPGRIDSMRPQVAGDRAARKVYEAAIVAHDPALAQGTTERTRAYERRVAPVFAELLGPQKGPPPNPDELPAYLQGLEAEAEAARPAAEKLAMVARMTFVGFALLFVAIFALSDIAITGRIRKSLRSANVTIGDEGGGI